MESKSKVSNQRLIWLMIVLSPLGLQSTTKQNKNRAAIKVLSTIRRELKAMIQLDKPFAAQVVMCMSVQVQATFTPQSSGDEQLHVNCIHSDRQAWVSKQIKGWHQKSIAHFDTAHLDTKLLCCTSIPVSFPHSPPISPSFLLGHGPKAISPRN